MRSQDTESNAGYSRFDRAILVGLFATVVFTALAHGAVESWAVAVFELLVVGLLLLWGIKIFTQNRIAISVPAAGLPLAALIAIGFIQSVAFTDGIGQRLSLSMDVEATRATLLALFLLVMSFVIAANSFASAERKQTLANFLIIYGLAMALFALVQYFTWNGRFYWIRPLTSPASSPFGPFVNRNHFAGYMEMLVGLPVAMLVTGTARRDSRLFYVFAATMMALAAIVSLSRGGMISLAAEMAFIGIMSAGSANRSVDRVNRSRLSSLVRPAALILVVIGSISAGIFWMGPERIVDRITGQNPSGAAQSTETFFSSRGWIWRETLRMIGANPFIGVGLGAYETAYPIYSKDDGAIVVGKSFAVDRAHNDYLQVLADCGVVGAVLAVWFIVLTFQAVARGRQSRDPLCRALAIGGGAGIFGLLVHSVFDFNLQIPSNALLFLLLTAAVSQAGAKLSATAREGISRRSAPPAGVAIGA